ncbi:MAG: hypothetical protein NZ822_03280 [Patescibacteria group bacterium]|nr:hypothetical protein [Patescibacteria group bacterium]
MKTTLKSFQNGNFLNVELLHPDFWEEVKSVVLAEFEPSEITKKLMKERYNPQDYPEKYRNLIEDYVKNYKHEVRYFPKTQRISCTCLGFKSARKRGRVCRHVWIVLKDFYRENNEILLKIMPIKCQKELLEELKSNQVQSQRKN